MYFSAVEKFANFDKAAFGHGELLFSYNGKGFLGLVSDPGFNRMLFDRRYRGKVSDENFLRVLDMASSGYRTMIFSMLGIGAMFFIAIFAMGNGGFL